MWRRPAKNVMQRCESSSWRAAPLREFQSREAAHAHPSAHRSCRYPCRTSPWLLLRANTTTRSLEQWEEGGLGDAAKQ